MSENKQQATADATDDPSDDRYWEDVKPRVELQLGDMFWSEALGIWQQTSRVGKAALDDINTRYRRRKIAERNHPGVWCCERGPQCRWPSDKLHNGLAWGTIPTDEQGNRPDLQWHVVHGEICGGRLIQLLQPKTGDR